MKAPQNRKKSKTSFYSKQEINEIFRRFAVQRPHPTSELHYNSAFTLLVAVVLSAQATDISVNKVTGPLFAVADTPEKIVALGEEKLGTFIRSIGLWRNKTKNVVMLSQALIDHHQSQVPQTLKALMALPGVGQKTANVVLNVAFGQATLAVDTHIFRLANRLELAPGKTANDVEKQFITIIPQQYIHHAHHWLILHGRYVCKARKPECQHCVIADICKAAIKTNAIPAPLVEIKTPPIT